MIHQEFLRMTDSSGRQYRASPVTGSTTPHAACARRRSGAFVRARDAAWAPRPGSTGAAVSAGFAGSSHPLECRAACLLLGPARTPALVNPLQELAMHACFLVAALSMLAASPAPHEDSGAFVVRLGQDTTFVEQYQRTPSRLAIQHVTRAPRVLERKFTYDYEKGEVTKASMVVTPPGAATPTQTIEATFGPDSARVRVQSGTAAPQTITLVVPPGTVVLAGSSPWAGYEGLLMQFAGEKRDTMRTGLYLLGGNSTTWVRLQRMGRDTVSITNGRNDRYDVHVDRRGRILGVLPVAGTARFSVSRVASVDLPSLAASFAAREQAGAGMGALSPRDSVVTTAGGAALWIDYGRPGKRGRVVFGDLVPWGQVWRTGANAATQLRTDKALDFGGTVVPAGFYTLWTVPTPEGWTLRFNGETGQWGTAHKPEKDLYSVAMKVSTLASPVERFTISVDPSAQGGTLSMDWDTTRASAAFTVKP